jgi:uncharacterized RmlC-like cupin family protein
VLEGTSIAATQQGRPGSVHIPVEPGSVFFVPPGATETAINASDARFREILIEIKGVRTEEALKVAVANVPGPPERRDGTP